MSDIVICDRRGNVSEWDHERAVSYSTSTAPSELLIEALGGSSTTAGIQVSRQLAFTVGAFRRAVSMISADMAKTALCLMKRDMETRRVEHACDHPAHDLMRFRPNSWQTPFAYKRMQAVHKELYGESFALKIFDGRGRVVELLPLLPDMVMKRRMRGGIVYEITMFYDDGSAALFEADSSQVIHEIGLTYDGVNGSGALRDAREVLGRMIAMRTFGASIFKNAARPATVIMLQSALKDDAREKFIQSWERMYSGLENAHKTAVLPPGAEIKILGINARDSQMVEIEQQSVREVANFFEMPASWLNENAQSAYKSLEQDEKSYESRCLDGRYVSSQETHDCALLSLQERKDGYFFRYERDPTRAADVKSLGEYYSKALGNNRAWMTPNEIRARLNMNPVEGGDELPTGTSPNDAPGMNEPPDPSAPGQMDPTEDPAEDPTDDGDAEDMMDAARAVAQDAVRRAVTRLVTKAKKAYRESGEAGALGVVDCRACEVTLKSVVPAQKVYRAAARRDVALAEGITIELFSAVRKAAKSGPATFEREFETLTATIAERLVA